MKKITIYTALICLLLFTALCAGCGGIEMVHYNNLSQVTEGAPKNIEGSYTEDMDLGEFETLTNLEIRQSLPETYESEPATVTAQYDKDGEIINITCGIGQDDNGYPVSISVFSPELWSDSGYSPIDYMYGSSDSDDLDITTIDQTPSLFYHYDDSQQQENKLGYDVYLAQFKLKGIYVYIESRAMTKGDFEQFVTTMIAKAHNLG